MKLLESLRRIHLRSIAKKWDQQDVIRLLQEHIYANWKSATLEYPVEWNRHQYYRRFKIRNVQFEIFCSFRGDLVTVKIGDRIIAQYVDQERQFGIGTNDELINITLDELKKEIGKPYVY